MYDMYIYVWFIVFFVVIQLYMRIIIYIYIDGLYSNNHHYMWVMYIMGYRVGNSDNDDYSCLMMLDVSETMS